MRSRTTLATLVAILTVAAGMHVAEHSVQAQGQPGLPRRSGSMCSMAERWSPIRRATS